MTITEINEAIDALNRALKNNVLTVKYHDNREVTYRSTGDLLAALRHFETEKMKLTGRSRRNLTNFIIE